MRILFVGDVVAQPGRRVIKSVLPGYLSDNKIDFCVINAENSAHGLGCSIRIVDELHDIGADIITMGNHTFSNSDFIRQASQRDFVVIPSNVSSSWEGNAYTIIEKDGKKLAVFNLMGQVDMGMYSDSPFSKADSILEELKDKGINNIILDFHAEATSEMRAMGFYLNGRVSAVIGTHTHVQTADNQVLSNGTGYITDAGMTGVCDSVIGMDIDTSLRRFVDKLPARYEPAEGDSFMCGVILTLDDSGKCTEIKRFCEYE